MKKAHCEIGRACTWLTGDAGAWIAAWAVIWMTGSAGPAWGQSSWPSYPNNTAISVTSGGNVGIGTTSPSQKLDVSGVVQINGGSGAAILQLVNNSLNPSRPAWITMNPYLNTFQVFTGVENPSGALSNFEVRVGDNNYGSAGALFISGATAYVGIGTLAPQYKLAVNGTIGAKEVIVTNTGWSDYVFRPGYRLRPLREVSQYIQANGHLPDIPTEAEVKEKGVSLGDMQAKLLAKVEELTLHLIQHDKENRELRARLAKLENRVAGQ